MARIFRFNQQAAMSLTMQAAQEAGLPVNMPQISQGIQALLGVFGKYGIGLSVDETSPYFQNLMANYGNAGQANNVKQVMPRAAQAPQQPVYMPQQAQQPQFNPQFVNQPVPQQPVYQPQAQVPQAPPLPMFNQPPPVQRAVPGAVISGQPLPDLLPPPHMRGAMQNPGITQLPGGPVQMQAQQPQGLGDIAPGMTEGPPPMPTILD
jgi:hypothetical protein